MAEPRSWPRFQGGPDAALAGLAPCAVGGQAAETQRGTWFALKSCPRNVGTGFGICTSLLQRTPSSKRGRVHPGRVVPIFPERQAQATVGGSDLDGVSKKTSLSVIAPNSSNRDAWRPRRSPGPPARSPRSPTLRHDFAFLQKLPVPSMLAVSCTSCQRRKRKPHRSCGQPTPPTACPPPRRRSCGARRNPATRLSETPAPTPPDGCLVYPDRGSSR